MVVFGYGAVKKTDLTGSVANVKMSDIKDVPVVSVDQALQGRIAGADIMATTGEPGATTSIRIRGTRSISASIEPLIIVDGVIDGIHDLNDINCDATKGRFAGYCAGILEAGYPMRPELCWTAEDYQLCGWEGADPAPVVERIMATVVKDRQPDAIIAANDPWAVELIQALKQNKFRVPEDIAVIGFGDYAGYCQSSTPRLTSISHGNDAIIAALVELVDGLVNNRLTGSEADLTDREVKSFLVERESIGRLTEESNVNQP